MDAPAQMIPTPMTPVGNRMADYLRDCPAADLCRDAAAPVAQKWAAMADGLAALSHDGQDSANVGRVHEQVARQI